MNSSYTTKLGPLPNARSLHLVLPLLMTLLLSPQDFSQAQAPPITSSGLNTHVSAPLAVGGQTQYDITGGTRPGGDSGANLFHSFGTLNVPTNNIANFLNDTGLPTSNILGRVTGGDISNIYGTIQTTGFGNANLFLMNPAGFLFGPNATVNVGGMMTFTTSDYMRLSGLDGSNPGIFRADTAQTSILTSAPVAAFGFIGTNPHAVDFIGGQLTVAGGTGLVLVGGGISLTPDSSVVPNVPSSITSQGRPIQMTSIAGPGEVAADTLQPASGMTLGAVTIGQATTLSSVGDLSFGNGSGGPVSIRGGEFVATGAQILTSPVAFSTGAGGEVTISVTGPASLSDLIIDTQSNVGDGGGGAVSMAASDLTLQNTSIMTGAFGDFTTPIAGGAGAVTLIGSDSVTLVESSIITISQLSNGNGGTVSVTAPVITLQNSQVETRTSGEGIPSITASSGPVTFEGGTNVSLTRSVISTDSIETQGNSGPVKISAPTVTISGDPDNPGIPNLVTSTHSFSGDPNSGHAGDIEISGTNVTFTDFARLESVADSTPETFSRGGNIRITGSENILLDNGTLFQTTTASHGDAGTMELMGQHVTIRGQSELVSETFGPGGAGTIKIIGTESIALKSGSIISTTAVPFSEGPAGLIELNTPELTISGGSAVQSETAGSGPGGTIALHGISGPGQSILISDSGSGIFTDTLSINLFGTIVGTGGGGNIFVHANSVMLQNGGMLSARTTGVGNAGDILVKADSVSVTEGAQLTSGSSIRETPLFSGEVIPSPTGNAGNVIIQGLASPAQSVLITGAGSSIFTDTQGTGAGGNIFVNANSVTLTNGTTVSASSTGQVETPGDAGSINITAVNGFTMQNSTITTQAGQGAGGGNIKVTTSPEATVLLQDSLISASVADGHGGGGNISIDPQFVILQNSQILAQADQGQGGAITITTNLFLPDANSIVNADSGRGVNGTVTIQSPNAPISGQIQPLNKTPLIATSLLNQHCAALAGGQFSSFTVTGRESLPTEPGSWLTSPLYAELGVKAEGGKAQGEGLEGATPALSLRQIAPAGFLTQAFAVERSAGCRS